MFSVEDMLLMESFLFLYTPASVAIDAINVASLQNVSTAQHVMCLDL